MPVSFNPSEGSPMKTRLICVIACAVLSMTMSTVAAGEGARAEAAVDPPKAGGAPREPSAAAEGQQNKMKRCNEEARKKEQKGDERRGFMSSCLKGDPGAPSR
jgi:hypothetical protein